jgi:hypothetical protein
MELPRRWDTDRRGAGVVSAVESVGAFDRLREAMLEADWVAEDPELHLQPQIRRLCEERGWHLQRAEVVDHALELEVAVQSARPRDLREAGFALVGSIAEANTHVAEKRRDDGLELVVTTGMLTGDSDFAPHGHVVRLLLKGSSGTA